MPQAPAPREDLKRPVVVSAVAHGFLVLFVLVAFPQEQRGEPWGGPGGGAIAVNVVRSLPGVPLPRPPVVAEGRRATEAAGLHEGRPREPEPEPQATEILQFGEEQRRRRSPPPRVEPRTPQPPGAIPSGEGGPPALPYTPFQVGPAEGGMAFGSGGSFGQRYPWYVESVRRRVSSNWLLSTVDPYVKWAPRLVISFEILRDGTVVNIQVMRSSGEASVDRSAIRAIQESSRLERLPSDYADDKVLVEFWFDFRRQ